MSAMRVRGSHRGQDHRRDDQRDAGGDPAEPGLVVEQRLERAEDADGEDDDPGDGQAAVARPTRGRAARRRAPC
jgi:hypothetical protein